MFIAGSRANDWDDPRRNYHRSSVRALSRANKFGALGVVYCDRNRLWLDARGLALNHGARSHACRLQFQFVCLCRIVMNPTTPTSRLAGPDYQFDRRKFHNMQQLRNLDL